MQYPPERKIGYYSDLKVEGNGARQSSEPNIVNSRQLASFNISRSDVEAADPFILALFSRVIVVHAESRYHTRYVEYIGYSDLFDPIPEEELPPQYNIICTVNNVPGYIPDEQINKWINHKAASFAEIKDPRIFYMRPFNEEKKFRKHNTVSPSGQWVRDKRCYVVYTMIRKKIHDYAEECKSPDKAGSV